MISSILLRMASGVGGLYGPQKATLKLLALSHLNVLHVHRLMILLASNIF